MKGKTLKKIIVSHILVASFVLITSIPFAVSYVKSVSNSEITSVYNTLCGDIADISNEFASADDLVSGLHFFDEIKNVIAMTEPYGKTDYYHASKAHTVWYTSSINLKLLRINYVFFSKNHIIFTPRRLFFSWDSFYGHWLEVNHMTLSEWKTQVAGNMSDAKRRFLPACEVSTFDENCFNAIIYDIPLTDTFNSGMVEFIINTDELLSALKLNNMPSDSFFCLYDRRGTLIYGNPLSQNECPSETGISYMKIGGESFCVFCVNDAETGLKYVIRTPVNSFGSNYIQGYTKLFIHMFTVFLFASILSSLFALRQYKPIRRLYTLLPSADTLPEDCTDEYQYFESTYHTLIENNRSYQQIVSDYEAALTTRAIEELLCRNIGNEKRLHELAARLELPDFWHAGLSMVEPRHADDHLTSNAINLNVRIMEALRNANVSISLIHPLSETTHFFVFPSDEHENVLKTLDEITRDIQAQENSELYFAVSGVYSEIAQLSEAHEECRSIMACKHLYGKYVLRPEDMEKTVVILTMNNANKLADYIQSGESERASELIMSFLHNNYLSEQDFEQLYYSMRGVLVQLSEIAAQAGVNVVIPFYRSDRIREENAEDLCSAANMLCDFFIEREKTGVKRLSASIIEYLKNTYTNPDVYGRSVADTFSINEKYLYTIFKEQTGVNFATYLENLRLSYAAELLKDGNQSVNEVAEKAGFNSPNTFYKAFKRVNGISPSAYRNSGLDSN